MSKTKAQLDRDIAEVLSKEAGSARPRVHKISGGKSFADRRVFVATVQYPGEMPARVEFAGPSQNIVGPVVMIFRGKQTMVTDPSRFGNFGRDWVRRFFEDA